VATSSGDDSARSAIMPIGTRARAENQAQNLEQVEPYDDPLLTIFGCRISPAAPKKPGPDQALDGRQELRD
jgi:hypothetical protein